MVHNVLGPQLKLGHRGSTEQHHRLFRNDDVEIFQLHPHPVLQSSWSNKLDISQVSFCDLKVTSQGLLGLLTRLPSGFLTLPFPFIQNPGHCQRATSLVVLGPQAGDSPGPPGRDSLGRLGLRHRNHSSVHITYLFTLQYHLFNVFKMTKPLPGEEINRLERDLINCNCKYNLR